MVEFDGRKVAVVGAGPVGCVLASLLAKRGFDVTAWEKRPDMRRSDMPGGRSINLVLTNRGLRSLDRLGLRETVLDITVQVRGRMMHALDGEQTFTAYGKDDTECNYSVSRGELNCFLLDAAERAGVEFHFDREVVDVDFDAGRLHLRNTETGEESTADAPIVFGADGAPSAVRRALVARHGVTESIEMLEYGYKELEFPAADDGEFAMAGHALHIWPRGGHMLMGLANPDGSFTGTIYLRHEGENSFAELDTPQEVADFFETHYPDAIPLLDDFRDEFLEHPLGELGTVRTRPWRLGGRALLIGDAAHGIVPFFGQGLNAGFEDCAVLDRLLFEFDELATVFQIFDIRRKPNAEAIADMAIENFVEMRDKVADEEFLLRKKAETYIEQNLDDIYRSRYALVVYSAAPYRVCYEIGAVQEELLRELLADVDEPEDVDLHRARRLIESKLFPLYQRYAVDLNF